MSEAKASKSKDSKAKAKEATADASNSSALSAEDLENLKQNGLRIGTFVDCKWRDDSYRLLFFSFFLSFFLSLFYLFKINSFVCFGFCYCYLLSFFFPFRHL